MTNCKFEAGKTYPLRGGGTAEILKVGINTVSGDTIVGLVKDKDGYEDVRSWHPDGNYLLTATHHFDLLPPEPERVSRWINVYRFPSGNSLSYVSREEADKHADPDRIHVLELIYEGDFFVDVIKHKVGE